MSKVLPHRLFAETYPVMVAMQTRFQDMDINGHLNNVAFAGLFENGRVRLNRELRPWAERPADERTMVAAVTINYLREGSFPEDVVVGSGIGRTGNSSWTIEQAMFQHDACIATCDTVVVFRRDNAAAPLSPALREGLEALKTREDLRP